MVNQSQFIEQTQQWDNEGTIRDLTYSTVEKAGKKFAADSKIRYIDISSVDNGTNTITGTTEYIFKDAPSRAQQCVRKGDILVSTVRPNLKNIAVNHLDGDDLVASSGFCVLRPKEGCAGLIMAYILSDVFTEKMTLVAKGTNYPAIHDSDILDYKIRLSEDRKVFMIDRLFKQADKSKFAGFKSQFIARFGTTEQSSYPVKTLREIALSSGEYGANTPATKYNPEKGRYIRITDIDEFGNLNDDRVSPEVADNKYLLHKGDLLFARTGATVGKTYLHKTGKALYAGYLIKYQFIDTVLPEFVFAYTHSKGYYQWVELTQKVGAQPNISAKQYDGLRIVVPPFEEQLSFVGLMNQADKSKFELKQAIEKIDKVMRALMQ